MRAAIKSTTIASGFRYAVRTIGALAVLAAGAAPAWAAEEAASPFDSTIGWVFRWLNFALVFGGLGYALAKYAPAAFRRRAETIVSAITEASRAKAEAERKRAESEAKLAALDQEIAAMRATAKTEGQSEAERLRALGREEAQKVGRAADAEILAAERAARAELKSIAGRLAIEGAEAQLRKELSPASDASLFRTFVGELAGSAR